MVFIEDGEELNVRASFYKDTSGALRQIYATEEHYDPCVYTLMFPFGGQDIQGWTTQLSKHTRNSIIYNSVMYIKI